MRGVNALWYMIYSYNTNREKIIIKLLQAGSAIVEHYLDRLVFDKDTIYTNLKDNKIINDIIVDRYQYNINIVKTFSNVK